MSTATDTQTDTKLKVPSLYQVILLNDDYTPMDFVIQVLAEIFNKNPEQAYALAMEVHRKGKGLAGTYSKEIAEQKVFECTNVAKTYKHPLKAVAKPA